MNSIMGIVLMSCAGLFFLALVAGVVVLIIYLTRQSKSKALTAQQGSDAPTSALSIAQERYANGTISREEYQQIVNDLNQK